MELRKWPAFRDQSLDFLRSIKLAHVAHDFALIVTKEDQVFISADRTVARRREVFTKIDLLCGKNITNFTFHPFPYHPMPANENVALTADGRIFSWGAEWFRNTNGSTEWYDWTTTFLNGELVDKNFINVASGMDIDLIGNTLALTDQGEVFTWYSYRVEDGINDDDIEDGINDDDIEDGVDEYESSDEDTDYGSHDGDENNGYGWIEEPAPKKVVGRIDGRKAVSIACTDLSSFVLLEDGQLFSWGDNEYGQLGIGNLIPQSDPVLVCNLDDKIIKQVACGSAHCLAMTDSGQIFAWGLNYQAQLGTGDRINQRSPVLVATNYRKAVQIAASVNRSAAMFENGTIVTWGDNMTYTEMQAENIDEAFAPNGMWRPFDLATTKTVAETQGLVLNDQKTTDISFQVGGRQILAHKEVLKQSCQYFNAMFQRHWVEYEKNVFTVDLFSYDLFYCFLTYLYTNDLNLASSDELVALLELADFYGHRGMQERCTTSISAHKKIAKSPHGGINTYDLIFILVNSLGLVLWVLLSLSFAIIIYVLAFITVNNANPDDNDWMIERKNDQIPVTTKYL